MNRHSRLVVRDIRQLPEGRGLETPLHPKRKRRRKWQRSSPSTKSIPLSPPVDTLSGATPLSPTSSTSPKSIPPPSPPVALLSGATPPSPTFVNCEIRERTPSPIPASPLKRRPKSTSTPRRSRHSRDEEDRSILTNYGSEDSSSDEESDEEAPMFPNVSRVVRGLLETPLDEDDAVEDSSTDADAAPADEVPLKATDQPWRLYDFEWRDFPDCLIPPESRREMFSQINVGPTTPRADPYDNFVDIWDRQIMEHIALETNRYAQQLAAQMLSNNSLSHSSRISRWYDTTVDELYTYFGIVLAMGIIVKSRMEEYWASTPDIFYTPGFSAHMPINRFLLLRKCLHFADNSEICALKLDKSEAKLYKIQPILSHLNKKFQELYTLQQNIALDESLFMWKGRLEMSQLIPNKVSKRGIKTYEICESQTGYLWRFEIHVRNKPSTQSTDPLDASTPSTVLRMVKGLEYKGYTLWMDNYYNSPCLARRLKSLGFDCVGTLRTDRKLVPKEIHCLSKRDMRPGEIAGLTAGDVDVMVWRDKNRVAMISTYHGNGQQTVRDSTKPILILDYNIMMGGVDKKDQLLATYPVERKKSNVWYKKFFERLLNISVLNSFIIHRHSGSLSHRNFRTNLIKSLLQKHSSPLPIPASPKIKPGMVDVTHRLAANPMGTRQRLRRLCTVCKKHTRTLCVGCEKTVCMEPCFVTLHSTSKRRLILL